MMPVETITSANVKQAVPFFGVTNMEASLRFYVDGLGFKVKRWWTPDDDQRDYKPEGRIRWCWLELGEAAIMLQEFLPEPSRRKRWELESMSVFSAKTR
jgi:lactoylglutathione lyase